MQSVNYIIAAFLVIYIVVYILFQRRFQFKNVFLQILLAIGLFIVLDFTFPLIFAAKKALHPDTDKEVIHFELDSILPTLLSPYDTGYSHHMGQNKNRFERKVAYTLQQDIDSPSKAVLICCYGGSSTYCVGMHMETSWPSVLQKRLADSGYHAVVHNHGVPGHNIKDAFANIRYYTCKDAPLYKKRIQLHYHGWNDIRIVNIPFVKKDDARFREGTQWHIESNRLATGLTGIEPHSEVYNFHFFRSQDVVPFKKAIPVIRHTFITYHLYRKILTAQINAVLKSFRKKMIRITDTSKPEVAEIRHNFRSYFTTYAGEIDYRFRQTHRQSDGLLFIPQLLNYPRLESEKKQTFSYWMPGVSEQFACLLTRDINDMLDKRYPQHHALYNLIQGGWSKDDFLDNGHFSEKGCIKFVDKITPEVERLINQ